MDGVQFEKIEEKDVIKLVCMSTIAFKSFLKNQKCNSLYQTLPNTTTINTQICCFSNALVNFISTILIDYFIYQLSFFRLSIIFNCLFHFSTLSPF